MNVSRWRAAVATLLLATCVIASAADKEPRKDVLKIAARVADWQLARMDASHQGITSFVEETRNSRSWQQGAFWVGMTRLADVSGEKRFHDAILAMGTAVCC